MAASMQDACRCSQGLLGRQASTPARTRNNRSTTWCMWKFSWAERRGRRPLELGGKRAGARSSTRTSLPARTTTLSSTTIGTSTFTGAGLHSRIPPCLRHGLPRSLDTWLEGVCKSFCDEHPWEVKGFQDVDSAKSVFFQESADGGNCDSDGESDDGGDECKSGASDCADAAPDAPCDASDGVEADAPAVPALNDPESNGASVANPPASLAD